MAINACDLCDCIPESIGPDFYYQASLNLLCGILAASGGGGGGGFPSVLEYLLCDDGEQKIVRVCSTTCGAAPTVTYLLADRTPSAAPLDWEMAHLGDCNAGTVVVSNLPLTSCDGGENNALLVSFCENETTLDVNLRSEHQESTPKGVQDWGVGTLLVREDSATILAAANGYYTFGVSNIYSAQRVDINAAFQDPSTIATSLLHLEDAVAASGDAGVGILLRRTDTAATQTSATGDYTLPVANLNGCILPDLNRTFQASDANGLLKAEDAGHVTGDAGVMALAVRNANAATLAGTELDYSPIGVNAVGAVMVDMARNFQSSAGPLYFYRAEDDASANADTGVPVLQVRQLNQADSVSADGDYGFQKMNDLGSTYTDPVRRGTPTTTTPTMLTATSVTIAAANAARRYLLIQNNSSANIMFSITNATLTGIVPTSTNIGYVLLPNGSYESPPNQCSTTAITAYQTSGGTINTVTVTEA